MQPLSVFCCGFPLDVGVWITLVFHLLSAIFYMGTCFSNIVLDEPTYGYNVSAGTQAFNGGYALASIPFIISGFSGVMYGREIHLRIYLYWFLLTVCLDFVLYLVVLFKNTCAHVPAFLADSGSSFACGSSRVSALFFLSVFLLTVAYCVYTVWSRCEELERVVSDKIFEDLGKTRRRNERDMVFQHKGGLFGTGSAILTPARPIAYGSLGSRAYGGSAPIFDGTRHDHGFPPPDGRSSW